jgi:hypothetical protein
LNRLRVVDLGENKISRFPNEWFLFEKLKLEEDEEIKIEQNGKFASLCEIFLQRNEFEELHPNFFCTFSSLRTLNLSLNRLVEIPDSLDCAREFQVLDLVRFSSHSSNLEISYGPSVWKSDPIDRRRDRIADQTPKIKFIRKSNSKTPRRFLLVNIFVGVMSVLQSPRKNPHQSWPKYGRTSSRIHKSQRFSTGSI